MQKRTLILIPNMRPITLISSKIPRIERFICNKKSPHNEGLEKTTLM